MEKNKKSQSGIEFMILIGTIIFLFTLLFVGFQESISDRLKDEKRISVQNVAIQVQDEINLASKSRDGYYREFEIPDKIKGLDYEISIAESFVYVKTTDNKHAVALPIPNTTGQVIIGKNIIKKEGGIVYLNP